MLVFNNVRKQFGKRIVLSEVKQTFRPGIYGLLGPNGAGKTTLMRCLNGIYKLSGGDITLNGVPISDAIKAGTIGYLPQKFGLFRELKVYQMMEYFATLKKIPRAEQQNAILESVQTVNLSERLQNRVGSLSGGMIRRLGIAQAILGDPQVLVFDEPTAGLDPEERMRFKNIISSVGKDRITIVSTHIVEDVEAVCNEILIMDLGKIIGGGTASQVSAYAKNKVYHLSEEEDLPEDCYIEKRIETQNGVVLRILTNTPLPNKNPVPPTVEDGFLCRIKGF